MELPLVVLVTGWAAISATILVREAPDAETKFWRAALAGALFSLWAFACIDIIPSLINQAGMLFPSDELLRWGCGVFGVAAAILFWMGGRFVRFGRASALHLIPVLVILAPFAYRFTTAPRSNWPVERLAQAAASESARTAQRAVRVLGDKGAPAVPALLKALEHPGLRIQATDALARVGEPAVEPLRARLADGPELSAAAAEALGKIGPPARVAVEELSRLIDGDEPGPRLAAIDALGRIGPSALFGIPALERAARTEPRAAAALAKVATPEAVKALREAAAQRRE